MYNYPAQLEQLKNYLALDYYLQISKDKKIIVELQHLVKKMKPLNKSRPAIWKI